MLSLEEWGFFLWMKNKTNKTSLYIVFVVYLFTSKLGFVCRKISYLPKLEGKRLMEAITSVKNAKCMINNLCGYIQNKLKPHFVNEGTKWKISSNFSMSQTTLKDKEVNDDESDKIVSPSC